MPTCLTYSLTCGLALLWAGPARADAPPRPAFPALDEAALREFTSTVMAATRILHEYHIRVARRAALVRWAVEGLYTPLGETLPARLDRELRCETAMREADLRRLLAEARRHLGKRPALDDLKDIDLALAGIFRRLEPGTVQRPQKDWRGGLTGIARAYDPVGIGVQLRKEPATGNLVVVTPIKDGPAYRARVMAGDVITSFTCEKFYVDRMIRQAVSTRGLSPADAEGRLLGKAGWRVWLTIRREGDKQPRHIEVARGPAEAETVFGVRRRADDGWDFLLDPADRIAYLRLAHLDRHTPAELDAVVAELKRHRVKGLVLDLRFNAGGPVTSGFRVAERFVPDGKVIVTIRSRVGQADYESDNRAPCPTGPIACLVNGDTAWTAEVLAACLQDHLLATVVGERTAGRVGIRNVVPLCGGEMEFTTGVFVRLGGVNLSKLVASDNADLTWGVRPDLGFAVNLTPAQRQALRQHMDEQAIIPRRDRQASRPGPAFTDRQLERALGHLRRVIRTGG